MALIGQLVNFLSAVRKPFLLPSGYLSPTDNTDFVWGAGNIAQTITGTIDGSNAVFTLPSSVSGTLQLYKNGVLQLLGTMYTVSGATITFLAPYIPSAGDYLQAFVV